MMRLSEVERGDRATTRVLFRVLTILTRSRFPDAARVAFYHREFAGPQLNAWTQQVMRGPSEWSVAERELMAAMVAQWNACPFCVGAHSAVAVHGMKPEHVRAALEDYRSAPLSTELSGALTFIEKLTLHPGEVTSDDALEAMTIGLSRAQLADAAAVAAVFNIITRYANALDFEIPSPAEFAASSRVLLKRGYA